MAPIRTSAAIKALLAGLLAAAASLAGAQPPGHVGPPGTPDPVSGINPHDLRPDFSTSATLMAPPVISGDDVIDFNDLRATRLGRRPPPIFNDDLKSRDTQRVRISGFMVPYDSLTDMRSFMLLPVPMGCFFCTPPSPKEVVMVKLDSKQVVPFVDEAIEVSGRLELWKPDSPDQLHKQFLFVLHDATFKKIPSQ